MTSGGQYNRRLLLLVQRGYSEYFGQPWRIFFSKLSQTSHRIAEGEVERGPKIDNVDLVKVVFTFISGGSDDSDLPLSQ